MLVFPVALSRAARPVHDVLAGDSLGTTCTWEPALTGPRVVAHCRDGALRLQALDGSDVSDTWAAPLEPIARQVPDGGVLDGHLVDGPAVSHLLAIDGLLPNSPLPFTPDRFSSAQPLHLVVTDIIAVGDHDLRERPWRVRRRLLDSFLTHRISPLHVINSTHDPMLARRWLSVPTGFPSLGVVFKDDEQAYGAADDEHA